MIICRYILPPLERGLNIVSRLLLLTFGVDKGQDSASLFVTAQKQVCSRVVLYIDRIKYAAARVKAQPCQ